MFRSWLLPALVLLSVGHAADDYRPGPDAQPQPGVPRGQVTQHRWASQIFAGTTRDYWVYVPAQYDGTTPAAVMVFQDGAGCVKPDGTIRVPIVFDNLIHRGEMPVTVGIFINPGTFPAVDPRLPGRSNRSAEYDTLSDHYARFLLEEILPEVGKSLRLTDDPERRAIQGNSSGGICAFTVAWQRPDAFRKVVSYIGSFTSIAYRPAGNGQPLRPGGDLYPTLIRKNPIKPLKIFLQDGTNDLDNSHGHWFLANQQMLAALQWANREADAKKTPGPRYQVRHEWGDGGHNGKHGGAIFPDVMRWLWSDQVARR
ncbi:MAG: esterase family protein [Verrucomicrobia bacterium]|nr:esterase family protein [Verrucomicrobiota bacterium]